MSTAHRICVDFCLRIGRRLWPGSIVPSSIDAADYVERVLNRYFSFMTLTTRNEKNRCMILEVIEQNTAAVKLYRAVGFREIRRLIGFSGPPVVAGLTNDKIASDLVEVDLREVAQAVTRYGLTDLPWQLSAETIAQLTPPHVAYRLNGAWIALTDPTAPTVTVRALIADKSSLSSGREAALLRAVMARYRGRKEWRLSAVWPEEIAAIISTVGLPRSPLTQWQMEREV